MTFNIPSIDGKSVIVDDGVDVGVVADCNNVTFDRFEIVFLLFGLLLLLLLQLLLTIVSWTVISSLGL
ncbi:hypothetical protein DERF_002087 [Dermatophagoides farinae]|uniref:Uncharacterized protein n=1 Tax=Dermatophagoides farinae TaxID=6954 RepID=A0A922L9A4_DERFA|nr:hypothetical protein DERF_002087 [Dermatophagoides farinae]